MEYWCNAPLRSRQKVVLISHALTANSRADEWWPELAGADGYLQKAGYHIICINHLGSCYGSTGPLSQDSVKGQPYYQEFPQLSIQDLARAQHQCLRALGYDRIDLLIGPSLGGQVAQELALLLGKSLKALCLIATNAAHSAWGIAFNESQRQAIRLDPSWGQANPDAGKNGMAVARSIALLSYRSYGTYQEFQGRQRNDDDSFRASSYQVYQGEKLKPRFNAFSYWRLSEAMDSHDALERLPSLHQPCLIISLRGDVLFPLEEQQELVNAIPKAQLIEIASKHGHDGFLTEARQITAALKDHEVFLKLKDTNYENSTHRPRNGRPSLLQFIEG